ARDEEQAGHGQVAIISEGLWQRRFGAAPAILGKTITLDGKSHTVIGIALNQARYPEETEVWKPLDFTAPKMQVRRFHSLRVIGRLKAGFMLEQARADLDAVAIGLEQEYPASNTSWCLRLAPLREELPSLEIGRATLVIRTSSDPLALAAAAPYGDITQQNPMAQRAGACAGDAGRFGAELEPIALQCDARMVRGARRNTMI